MDRPAITRKPPSRYSGLAPGFAGLYQINFTMPTGPVSSPASIEIYSGVDSDSVEALIPFTTLNAARLNRRIKAKSLQRPHVRRHRIDGRASEIAVGRGSKVQPESAWSGALARLFVLFLDS